MLALIFLSDPERFILLLIKQKSNKQNILNHEYFGVSDAMNWLIFYHFNYDSSKTWKLHNQNVFIFNDLSSDWHPTDDQRFQLSKWRKVQKQVDFVYISIKLFIWTFGEFILPSTSDHGHISSKLRSLLTKCFVLLIALIYYTKLYHIYQRPKE